MKIKDAKVYPVSDLAQLAQARIQQAHSDIDPIIAISHGLRQSGFAADALTIVNEKTNKRILMIFHDNKPDTVDYEFGLASEDPRFEFKHIALANLTEEVLYQWMSEHLT